MNDEQAADVGTLILRLYLGLVLLPHGIHKILYGVEGIAGMLEGRGLPGVLAYGVYLGEVIGPLLVILGFYTRIGAGLIAANMVVALWLAHMGQLLLLNDHGGWALELQGFFLFSALALVFLGGGRLAVQSESYRRL